MYYTHQTTVIHQNDAGWPISNYGGTRCWHMSDHGDAPNAGTRMKLWGHAILAYVRLVPVVAHYVDPYHIMVAPDEELHQTRCRHILPCSGNQMVIYIGLWWHQMLIHIKLWQHHKFNPVSDWRQEKIFYSIYKYDHLAEVACTIDADGKWITTSHDNSCSIYRPCKSMIISNSLPVHMTNHIHVQFTDHASHDKIMFSVQTVLVHDHFKFIACAYIQIYFLWISVKYSIRVVYCVLSTAYK